MTKVNKQQEYIIRELKIDEIIKLDKEKNVVVNRVILNSKLVEFEMNMPNGYKEKSAIIRRALINMSAKEDNLQQELLGAEMKVSDVISVFDSFASLKNRKRLFFEFDKYLDSQHLKTSD